MWFSRNRWPAIASFPCDILFYGKRWLGFSFLGKKKVLLHQKQCPLWTLWGELTFRNSFQPAEQTVLRELSSEKLTDHHDRMQRQRQPSSAHVSLRLANDAQERTIIMAVHFPALLFGNSWSAISAVWHHQSGNSTPSFSWKKTWFLLQWIYFCYCSVQLLELWGCL